MNCSHNGAVLDYSTVQCAELDVERTQLHTLVCCYDACYMYIQVHSVRRKCILAELSLKPAANSTTNSSNSSSSSSGHSSRGQLLRWRWLGPATIALVYSTEVCYWAVVASSGAAQPLRRGFKRSAEVTITHNMLCTSADIDSIFHVLQLLRAAATYTPLLRSTSC
jgi:hypothetical protein